MVNPPAQHSTWYSTLPTALRLLRWIAVAFVLLNCVSAIASVEHSRDYGVELVVTIWSAVAAILALYRPMVGALASIVPVLSTLFVGGVGQDVLPLMASIIMMCAVATPRAAVFTVAGAFAYAVATGQDDRTGGRLMLYVAFVGLLVVIGCVVRALLTVSRRTQGRIAAIEAHTMELRLQERSALADELSDLLADGLADQQSTLDEARDETDPGALQTRMAAVERHARESLSQLRGLVSTLRGRGPTPPPTAPAASSQPSLTARAEELEDILVGHGYPTEMVLPPPGARVGDFARRVLGDILLGAAPTMVARTPPGAQCKVTVMISRENVGVELVHPLAPDSSEWESTVSSLPPELQRASDALIATGGTFTVDAEESRWTLRATLPQRLPARQVGTPPTPSDPASDSRTWAISLVAFLRWSAGLVSTVAAVLAAGEAADARASGVGDGDWSNMALWMLLWVALAVSCWRVWPGVGLLIAVLGVSALVSPPVVEWFQPAHVAIMALGALVVAHRRGWWWLILIGWCVYVVGWFWPALSIDVFGALLMSPLLGLGAGFAANHFLQLRDEQLTQLDEAKTHRMRARDEVRNELAGELHDIVAHQLSLLTLQVEAHRHESDPERLRAGLDRIATINQSAQADLGLLLHVMRSAETSTVSGPAADPHWLTPSSATRAAAATLRDAGHTVTVDVDAAADSADATTQKTVTRIIREATTNILRYAPARARCVLSVTCDAESIHVEIVNPLPNQPRRSEHSTGLGLIGLDERVRITGGELTTGVADGSWRVAARLPLATTIDLRPRAEDEAIIARSAA